MSGEPTPAPWIFDYAVTQEHRFYDSILFKKIGYIDIREIQKKFKKFSYSSLEMCKDNIEKLGVLKLIDKDPYRK